MFKAVGHIFLSLLLLISTTGIAVSRHYCGGEIVSTTVLVEASSCCGSDSCCKNEIELIQLDVEYSVSSTVVVPSSVKIDLFGFSLAIFDLNVEEILLEDEFIISDLPPPPKIQALLANIQSYLL